MSTRNAARPKAPFIIATLVALFALFFGWVLFVQLRVPESGLAL